MAWLFSMILAVTLGARQLPREEETGTVFPLLAKPVSRAELLAGKWLGVWTSASAATAAFYGLAAGVAGLRGAFPAWGSLGQAWLLHAAAIGVVVSLALLLSTRLSQGAAATLTFALVFGSAAVVPQIPWMLTGVTSGARWGCMLLAYYALPHLEVFDMRRRVVHEWGPAPWGSCGLVLAYGTCLTLLFLVAAWLAYRGKRFKRGGA
jgi:ABC-type transport system involved in multi-copper enzyme maturation permease subunit